MDGLVRSVVNITPGQATCVAVTFVAGLRLGPTLGPGNRVWSELGVAVEFGSEFSAGVDALSVSTLGLSLLAGLLCFELGSGSGVSLASGFGLFHGA